MDKGDGYDEIRRAYRAGVAAAVAYALPKDGPRKAPDVENYVNRLKARPLVAKLLE